MTARLQRLMGQLAAIENRELGPLRPGEQARVTAHLTRAGVKVARGKAPGRADAAIDRVFAKAAERVEIEIAAERQRIDAKRQAAIQKRAARKGWW